MVVRTIVFIFYMMTILGCSGGGGDTPNPAASPVISNVALTGFVYERDPTVPYSLNLTNVNTKIKCTRISLDNISSSCANDGSYALKVPSPDYRPIKVEKNGYIPTDYTVWGSENQEVSLGLYQAPTVTARAGFMKGMVYLDLGNTYPYSFWSTIIDEPKVRLNADLVSYVDVGFNHGCNATTSSVSVSAYHPDYPSWRLATKAELAPLVSKVHAAGMAFNMWLGVINVKECSGNVIYNWSQADTAFWDSWFSAYRTILLERAQVAKDLGIEWITLGHNMDYVSRLPASRWASIITEMRTLYPSLKITYFGGVNFAEIPTYFESDGYNQGAPDGFASLLDAVGHAVTAISTTQNPSRNTIKANFETLRLKSSTLSVPIWVLLMQPSTAAGASDPTFMEPELLTDNIALSYTTDFYQQADIYQALFEVINGSPVGSGQLMGVLPWGYHLRNNFRDSGPESNSSPYVNNLIVDRTANIRGKPAESITKWWFSRF